MAKNEQKIGWIGMGRMGFPMAERLLKAGYDVSIWNRTRAKAEPLAAKGGKVADKLADLAGVDVLFSIVSTGKDLKEVYFGKDGVVTGRNGKLPKIFVDCSTIAVEDSADIREQLKALGADFVAAPISGNAKVIKAGRLSSVISETAECRFLACCRPKLSVRFRRGSDDGATHLPLAPSAPSRAPLLKPAAGCHNDKPQS